MEQRSSTVFLQWFLSWACRSVWVHCRPICRSTCSADLPQLFFGLPRTKPWGFQKSGCLIMFLYGFLSVWPIHLHFLLLIWVVIFSYSWVFASGSSLLMVFDHRTPRMLRGQRFVKAWIFGEIFFVTLQVSAPYIRTDFTFVLKILSLVLRDISLDLHTSLSRRNAGGMLSWLCQSSPAHLVLFLHRQLSRSLGK